MAVRHAVLKAIRNGDTIPEEFLLHLQRALLMALQEQGRLSITEYRRAEERLTGQRRSPVSGIR